MAHKDPSPIIRERLRGKKCKNLQQCNSNPIHSLGENWTCLEKFLNTKDDNTKHSELQRKSENPHPGQCENLKEKRIYLHIERRQTLFPPLETKTKIEKGSLLYLKKRRKKSNHGRRDLKKDFFMEKFSKKFWNVSISKKKKKNRFPPKKKLLERGGEVWHADPNVHGPHGESLKFSSDFLCVPREIIFRIFLKNVTNWP